MTPDPTEKIRDVQWGDLPDDVEISDDDDVEEEEGDVEALAEHLAAVAAEQGIHDDDGNDDQAEQLVAEMREAEEGS